MSPLVVAITPRRANLILIIASLVLISIGIGLLKVYYSANSCEIEYESANAGKQTIMIDHKLCPRIGSVLNGKYSIYYKLSNYYQNHKEYRKSIDYRQLTEGVVTDKKKLSNCSPCLFGKDGRILHPCGCIARRVFTDRYRIFTDSDLRNEVEIDDSREAICTKFGVHTLFKNPKDKEKQIYADLVDFWLDSGEIRTHLGMDRPGTGEGVENSHFINWINLSAHPNFKKLYAVIEAKELALPLYLSIDVSYIVKPTELKRKVIISKQSYFGDSAYALALHYITTGFGCLALVFLSIKYSR